MNFFDFRLYARMSLEQSPLSLSYSPVHDVPGVGSLAPSATINTCEHFHPPFAFLACKPRNVIDPSSHGRSSQHSSDAATTARAAVLRRWVESNVSVCTYVIFSDVQFLARTPALECVDPGVS